MIYKRIIKPIFFRKDPELVHNRITKIGNFLGRYWITRNIVSMIFNYDNNMLRFKLLGIDFRNPIGLSAGFDYEAKLTQILPSVGFGFNTIGSVTYKPYEGNKLPRLGRLPKSRSLLVNKGLKNTGSESIKNSLTGIDFKIPLGISIAKTNCKKNSDEKEGIKDYIESLKIWEKSNIGSYYELNISCPNTFGGEPFTTPDKLEKLLKEVDKLNIKKPIFIKMPVDFSEKDTESLCNAAAKHNIQGLIFGNLTKDRQNPLFDQEEIKTAGIGNFSGHPTFEKSNKLIKFAYKKYQNRFIIIGCGGVFSAEDAYEKIKSGASLIQMITGMIYNGPGVIKDINKGLARLLERDGFKNIQDAVGSSNKSS